MKKLLSLLLCAALASCVLSALCALPVNAEADYTGEVWTPLEIKLTSTATYKNAYTDAELDATFTHEDGTVISVPGFWDGGQDWCVRFSPTKTGTWTFSTACSNKDDKGLFVTGTVKAVPSTGTTGTAKHGFVKISDNKRYFVYDDGTPFFWLGDTNWLAPECVAFDENNYPYSDNPSMLKTEVDNRVSKGFTVYQTYFACDGSRQGLKDYWSSRGKKIRPEVFRDRIDKMFQYIHDSGLVIALGFGAHVSTPNTLPEEEHLRFIRYCVARYGCYNIVWITGQEVTDDRESMTAGKDCLQVWIDTAAYTDQLDGYNHPQGAHMYPLVPWDERARRLHNTAWHNVWILQGSHNQVRPKSFYQNYYTLPGVKPVIEGEANYEDLNGKQFVGYDLPRYSAWKSMMCGCAGFTYGAVGIWASCYSTEGRTGWFDAKGGSYNLEPWYMGLDKPGSFEVKYMKRFFENLPDWTKLVPRFNDLKYGSFATSEYKCVSSVDDGSTFVCYFFNNDVSTGTLLGLKNGADFRAWWFNPRTGKYRNTELAVNGTSAILPEKPDEGDWALLITSEALSGEISLEEPFEDLSARGSAVTGDAVTPVSVTAIGGLVYDRKMNLTDHTSYLYDNDPSTVWRPFAERGTQTIVYDLGTPQSLTHLVLQPADNTTLPRFRVEGSNDGDDWTILVNTTYREPLKDGSKISEPLAGVYRYVKVLLLVQDDIPKEEAESSNLEYFHQESWDIYFYRTAISELTVYASGEATLPPASTPTEAPRAAQTTSIHTALRVVMIAIASVSLVSMLVYVLKAKKKNPEAK